MAVAHCILGKFLGVVCHYFPPPLDVPTFAARCLYVRKDARDPSSERRNWGREIVWYFCLNSDFHVNLGISYMPQICDMGPTALLPLRRKACWGFFRPKNPTASAGFEPANLGTKDQHATPRPPKPTFLKMCLLCSRFIKKQARITETLCKDLITFMTISGWILLKMRNICDKGCRGNQTARFMFNNYPPPKKPCHLWDNVEKYCRAGQATDGNMVHAYCMLDT